ncbi:MAG: M24 family metallopeptidase [Patescibacteria group bacterium]|nr:M24 family metallopeptidase [Patescibacteria group bacterium]
MHLLLGVSNHIPIFCYKVDGDMYPAAVTMPIEHKQIQSGGKVLAKEESKLSDIYLNTIEQAANDHTDFPQSEQSLGLIKKIFQQQAIDEVIIPSWMPSDIGSKVLSWQQEGIKKVSVSSEFLKIMIREEDKDESKGKKYFLIEKNGTQALIFDTENNSSVLYTKQKNWHAQQVNSIKDLRNSLDIEKPIIASKTLPIGIYSALDDMGIDIQLCSQIFPERDIKDESELEVIQKAQTANESVLSVLREIIKRAQILENRKLEVFVHTTNDIEKEVFGNKRTVILTSDHLRSIAEKEFNKRGYDLPFIIIACGADSAIPHELGKGPLRADVPIIIDIFPRCKITGYWADMTRTYFKGSMSDLWKQRYDSVKTVQLAAIQKAKANIFGQHLYFQSSTHFDDIGQDSQYFSTGLGHSVGIDIHDGGIVMSKREGTDFKMKEGMVLTIEPGLYFPDEGGIRLENMIYILEDGNINITQEVYEPLIP